MHFIRWERSFSFATTMTAGIFVRAHNCSRAYECRGRANYNRLSLFFCPKNELIPPSHLISRTFSYCLKLDAGCGFAAPIHFIASQISIRMAHAAMEKQKNIELISRPKKFMPQKLQIRRN